MNFASLRWLWHPFFIVEFCTFHFSFGGIAKLGGILAAPFTGGASLAITAASIQHDAQADAIKAQQAEAEAAQRIAEQNRAAAEAQAAAEKSKLAAMQSASALPFTQAFSSSPLGGSGISVGGLSPWILLGFGAVLFFFILRR